MTTFPKNLSRLGALRSLLAATTAAATLSATVVLCTWSQPTQAKVTRFVVEEKQVYAGGAEWGAVGAYEHISGRAYMEVDPADARNAVIVNLDKASRNQRGMVEFSAPVSILKPVTMSKGNGKIFYNVNNRGNSNVGMRDSAEQVGGTVALQLRRGFTLVDAGWHGDGVELNLPPGTKTLPNGLPYFRQLFADLPVARQPDGKPIVGKVRLEFSGVSLMGESRYTRAFAERFKPYEAASTDTGGATLVVRERAGAPATAIAADRWAFGTCPEGKDSLKPGTTSICFFDGFSADRLYELVYPAQNPIVMGLGYAVTRDVAAFLRNNKQDDAGNANPLAAPGVQLPLRVAHAYGASSTGMYLRDFLYLGFNEDEQGRKVFDGVFIHTGGALRLFANVAFSHPTFYASQDQHRDYLSTAYPPFTYGVTHDPVAGVTDGILKRPKTDPLVMELVDENSFWQWKNSLQVVDGQGQSLAMPDNARLYFTSGSGHLGIHGIMSAPTTPNGYAGECRYEAQALAIGKSGPSFGGALMVALDEWVDGKALPPASNFPTLENGGLISLNDYRQRFPAIPGLAAPAVMAEQHVQDFGAEFSATGGRLTGSSPKQGAVYSLFVPVPDADGMAVSPVRPMEVAAPIGTNVGWNIRRAGYREGDLCGLEGTFIPFAKTKVERQRNQDPRLSLEERYGNHQGFVTAVRTAAEALLRQRFLLPEDVEQWVKAAEQSDILK